MNNRIKRMLRLELLGYHIYNHMSLKTKDLKNQQILKEFANQELRHYEELSEMTNTKVELSKLKILFSKLILSFGISVFGLSFMLKLYERSESRFNKRGLLKVFNSEVRKYIETEESNERELLSKLDEDRLSYIGSIVLGLNDALVELSGALAGFTLSLQNSRTIALLGLITGISAAFSMAASEYLSTKEEDGSVSARTASLYTGLTYFFTVLVLIVPYTFGLHYIASLGVSLLFAILIIAVFNYYIAVVKDQNFFKRFKEMAIISIGIAAISFGIGFAVDKYIGI